MHTYQEPVKMHALDKRGSESGGHAWVPGEQNGNGLDKVPQATMALEPPQTTVAAETTSPNWASDGEGCAHVMAPVQGHTVAERICQVPLWGGERTV